MMLSNTATPRAPRHRGVRHPRYGRSAAGGQPTSATRNPAGCSRGDLPARGRAGRGSRAATPSA